MAHQGRVRAHQCRDAPHPGRARPARPRPRHPARGALTVAGRTLDVHMDGTRAGTLSMTGAGNIAFSYDDAYRNAPGSTPLSLSMPKVMARHRQRVALPFVQGLLPDNERALASLATTYQVSARSPFALLEHVGADVAGALQLLPPGDESTDATADRAALEPISEDEVADDLARVID